MENVSQKAQQCPSLIAVMNDMQIVSLSPKLPFPSSPANRPQERGDELADSALEIFKQASAFSRVRCLLGSSLARAALGSLFGPLEKALWTPVFLSGSPRAVSKLLPTPIGASLALVYVRLRAKIPSIPCSFCGQRPSL